MTRGLFISLEKPPHFRRVQVEQPSANCRLAARGLELLTDWDGAIGHIDWLYANDGQRVGVRIWFFEDGKEAIHWQEIIQGVSAGKLGDQFYVDQAGKALICLFDPKMREWDEERSCEMLLDESLLMRTVSGEKYALLIAVDDFSEVEFAAIQLIVDERL